VEIQASGAKDLSGFVFSPDRSRLLVLIHAYDDPIYDARTLERVGSFSLDGCFLGTGGPPLSFSPDGSRVVGCSGEYVNRRWTGGLVRIWDAHSGEERMVLRGPGGVSTPTFVGQGDRVMTTGDGLIRLWDTADGKKLVQIRVREETGAVVWAGASPDGTFVASGTDWKWAGVWDTRTGQLTVKLEGARENTDVDRFTPDGRYVVTRDDTGTLGLWDPRTGKRVRALRGAEARIISIDLSASGHRLLAGAADPGS
jgi:WD40 repeat protein